MSDDYLHSNAEFDAAQAENARLRAEIDAIRQAVDADPGESIADAMRVWVDETTEEVARLTADVVTSWNKIVDMAAERNAETAKADALTRTVAALRQTAAMVLVSKRAIMDAVVDSVPMQKMIDLCAASDGAISDLEALLASPDVTIPADAWVSRAEHDRVVGDLDARLRDRCADLTRVGLENCHNHALVRERDQTIAMLREAIRAYVDDGDEDRTATFDALEAVLVSTRPK